jgi:hypothetical protein
MVQIIEQRIDLAGLQKRLDRGDQTDHPLFQLTRRWKWTETEREMIETIEQSNDLPGLIRRLD